MPTAAHPALTVLLVEDDAAMQLGCVQALQLAGLTVEAVDSAEAACRRLGWDGGNANGPRFAGVVVTDMRLPGADGLWLVQQAHAHDEQLPIIMITGHGDMRLAVEAMRAGAYDFIPKPFASDTLVEVVRRALDKRALTLEVARLRQQLKRQTQTAGTLLVGESAAMQAVNRLIEQVASSPVDVLVLGETGTGKELVAQALHRLSPRHDQPFVALNCGGMPDNLLDSELFGHEAGAFTGAQRRRVGKIEHAGAGTLFLDELETMPMAMQIKLLRVLQERQLERLGSNALLPVKCRVVAAAKGNLQDSIRAGQFRADLYYRLNVVRIELPPLRERMDDIPLLLEHFMLLAASRYDRPVPSLPPDELRSLLAHDWPGNLRELRNFADARVLGLRPHPLGEANRSAVAAFNPGQESLADAVDRYERSLIHAELQRCGGNIARTAEALRTAKTTLHDKIRKHGLNTHPGQA